MDGATRVGAVRRRCVIWVLAVLALVTGCTNSSPDPGRSTSATPSTSRSGSSSSSVPSTTASSTPVRPTIPPDVPRTGLNLRPGEKPPVMPVAATVHSAAGAQAFAVFFVKTIDWGYATTSSAYMRHYYNPKTCGECIASATAIDNTRDKHWHYLGGRIEQTANSALAGEQLHGSEQIVRVDFNVQASTAVDVKGDIKAANTPVRGGDLRAYLAWEKSSWHVVFLYFKS